MILSPVVALCLAAAKAGRLPVPATREQLPEGTELYLIHIHQGATVSDPNRWFRLAEERMKDLQRSARGIVRPEGKPVRMESYIKQAEGRLQDLLEDMEAMAAAAIWMGFSAPEETWEESWGMLPDMGETRKEAFEDNDSNNGNHNDGDEQDDFAVSPDHDTDHSRDRGTTRTRTGSGDRLRTRRTGREHATSTG